MSDDLGPEFEYRARIVWANGHETVREAFNLKDARRCLRQELDVFKRGPLPTSFAGVEVRRVEPWTPYEP